MGETIKKSSWVMSETEFSGKKIVLLRDVERSCFIVQTKYVSGIGMIKDYETLTSALDEVKRQIMCEYWEYLV